MKDKYRSRENLLPVLSIDEDFQEAIDEAIQGGVRRGILVDSGKRRWSKRNGRYEIVWKSKIFAPVK